MCLNPEGKVEFVYKKSQWNLRKPTVCIREHWTDPSCTGLQMASGRPHWNPDRVIIIRSKLESWLSFYHFQCVITVPSNHLVDCVQKPLSISITLLAKTITLVTNYLHYISICQKNKWGLLSKRDNFWNFFLPLLKPKSMKKIATIQGPLDNAVLKNAFFQIHSTNSLYSMLNSPWITRFYVKYH